METVAAGCARAAEPPSTPSVSSVHQPPSTYARSRSGGTRRTARRSCGRRRLPAPPPSLAWLAARFACLLRLRHVRSGRRARAELLLHDLAGGVDRQLRDGDHVPRHLVVGEALAGPADDRVGIDRASRGGNDVRHGDLAHALVGHADDRDLTDRVVGQQDVLDLGRVHVEAADDEHVLQPSDDPHVAAVVHRRQVAGVQEAPLVDGSGRRLRVVEIALHHAVAADEQLARRAPLDLLPLRVGDDDLETGHRAPGRRGDRLRVVVGPGPRARPRLGESVAGEDRAERELGAHLADQLRPGCRPHR